MKLRSIIVDDEALGRRRMRMLLREFPNVTICAECEGGKNAVEMIQQHKPDLIFLDIQMPDLDGFGVINELRALGIPIPTVIFVTAFNEHAVRAFDVNAIDYLLKPVQGDRLGESIHRVEKSLDQSEGNNWQTKLGELMSAIQPSQHLTRIEIRSQGRTDYVRVQDISWLKADRNYIEVHTQEQIHIARIPLAELERQLDPKRFKRVSRSAMVNLTCVRSIESLGRSGYEVILNGNTKIPVTCSVEELRNQLRYVST